MRCEYTVTYKDFCKSLPAYRKVSRQARFGYLFTVWILPLVGCFFAAFLFKLFQPNSSLFGADYWLGCLGLGMIFGFPARYRLGLRRAFRQRNTLIQGGIMICEFDAETIRFIVPSSAEISYAWDAFTHYYENDTVMVLLVDEAAFHTIPKNAMGPSGWDYLRSILHQHAGIKPC